MGCIGRKKTASYSQRNTVIPLVSGEKAGVCPEVFGDYSRDESMYGWCEHDRDCSYDHKCCPNKYNYKVCGPPGPGMDSFRTITIQTDLPDQEQSGPSC